MLVYQRVSGGVLKCTHDRHIVRASGGSADQRTSGSADQRTSGPADQRISGPADQRIPLVRWSAGPLVRWSADPLVRWSRRWLIRWSAGPLVRWSADPLVRCRQPRDHKSTHGGNPLDGFYWKIHPKMNDLTAPSIWVEEFTHLKYMVSLG